MEKIEIDRLSKFLINAQYVGMGTTAICFRKNEKCIKIFRNTWRKKALFYYHDMLIHLEELNSLNNESFLVPEKILSLQGEIIGYIAPYKKSRTFARIKKQTKIKDLMKALEKLIQDTDKISNQLFQLQDIHNKNILYNGQFFIIDLDFTNRSVINLTKIIQYNREAILKTILYTLFSLRIDQLLKISSLELQTLYDQTLYQDYHKVFEFFNHFSEISQKNDLKVKDLKRSKLIAKEQNTYFKYF